MGLIGQNAKQIAVEKPKASPKELGAAEFLWAGWDSNPQPSG